MKKILLLFVFLFLQNSAKAQLDLEHWFPPVYKTAGEISNAVVSLSTDKTNSFKVFMYNGDQLLKTVILSKDNPVEYDLGNDLGAVLTGKIDETMKILNEGLHLVGENSFYANLKFYGRNSEVISSKGKTALGKSFFIVNDQNIVYTESRFPYNYQASIMAYSDNTHIKIKNYSKNLVFTDGSKPDELNITLNKNQTYIVAALKSSNYDPIDGFNDYFDPNLIGATITSDQSIVVTNGNFLSQDAGLDVVGSVNLDQNLPLNKIGKEYFLINGMSMGNFFMEKALIVATEDNTQLFYNNETTPFFTLQKGEHFIGPYQEKKFLSGDEEGFTNEEGRFVPTSGMFIKSTKPIYCYQLLATFHDKPKDPRGYVPRVGSSSAMLLSYPLDKEYQVKNIVLSDVEQLGSLKVRSKISIKSEKNANITVNGNPLSGGSDITGKPGWKYNTLQNLKGKVIIQSDKSLNVDFVGGINKIEGAEYSGYAGSVVSYSNDPFITVNGNCIEEGMLLTLTNTDFDLIQWQKDGVDIPNANSSTFVPKEAGIYTCVLTYSGLKYTTNSINVANCPYTVIEKDFGSICDFLQIQPAFSAPNQNVSIAKLEIKAPPFNGNLTITAGNIKYVPNEGFSGNDRFVYQICNASNGLCETVKANVFVNEKPTAEIISEIYPNFENNGKGTYDLTKVIIDQALNQYNFYEDANLTTVIVSPSAFETSLPKVFLKISAPSGCYIVKEITLLTLSNRVDLPNFFSPNGDGINDLWDFSNLKSLDLLQLSIFDKLGIKVFNQNLPVTKYNWDGKDNFGKALPSATYWAIIIWKNARTGAPIIKNQWILLKNRN